MKLNKNILKELIYEALLVEVKLLDFDELELINYKIENKHSLFEFQINNHRILMEINTNDNINYYTAFGVWDSTSNKYLTNKDLNDSLSSHFILSYIFTILRTIINKFNIEHLFYVATPKRAKIYKLIIDKYFTEFKITQLHAYEYRIDKK